MSLFWLSFVDTDKSAPPDEQVPGGGGFLGCAIVRVDDSQFTDEKSATTAAVSRAWEIGINPGGEVGVMGPIPDDAFPEEFIERDTLIMAEEAEDL